MDIIASHIVPLSTSEQRLSDYLIGKMEWLPSRKSVKKAIKKEAVRVNDQLGKTGYWVQPGDRIDLINTYQPPGKIYHTSLQIIFEDQDIALIQKLGGIPTSGNYFRTVYNALGYNLSIDPLANFYPQPVHRLDSATSGLLLIAKTQKARIHLGNQFEKNEVAKKYQALVHGNVGGSGSITIAVDQKKAATDFELVNAHCTKNGAWISHLVLTPKTGRTHQLRKHCLQMGHPILGDKLYQIAGWQLKQKGLLLCATHLSFKHPTTEKILQFELELPAKFNKIMAKP